MENSNAPLHLMPSSEPDDDLLPDDGAAEADEMDDESARLYEHFRVVADRGQQLLRVDRFCGASA